MAKNVTEPVTILEQVANDLGALRLKETFHHAKVFDWLIFLVKISAASDVRL